MRLQHRRTAHFNAQYAAYINSRAYSRLPQCLDASLHKSIKSNNAALQPYDCAQKNASKKPKKINASKESKETSYTHSPNDRRRATVY